MSINLKTMSWQAQYTVQDLDSQGKSVRRVPTNAKCVPDHGLAATTHRLITYTSRMVGERRLIISSVLDFEFLQNHRYIYILTTGINLGVTKTLVAIPNTAIFAFQTIFWGYGGRPIAYMFAMCHTSIGDTAGEVHGLKFPGGTYTLIIVWCLWWAAITITVVVGNDQIISLCNRFW